MDCNPFFKKDLERERNPFKKELLIDCFRAIQKERPRLGEGVFSSNCKVKVRRLTQVKKVVKRLEFMGTSFMDVPL